MSSRFVQQQFETVPLPELMRQLYRGHLLIPVGEQAPWDDERKLELFESVYRGVPIGSITRCRTTAHLEHVRELGELPLRELDDEAPVRDYVLSGRSRVSALFEELGASFRLDDHSSSQRPKPANRSHRSRVNFDLKTRTFQLRKWDEPNPPAEFPLIGLFHPQSRHEFASRLEAMAESERLENRFTRLVDAFYDYPIPVITFVSNDLEQIRAFFSLEGKQTSSSVELTPKTTFWICDECRKPIKRPEDGVVEWIAKERNGRISTSGLRIVHQTGASPRSKGCHYDEQYLQAERAALGDLGLKDFLGHDGLTHLLSLISEGMELERKTIEVIQRLHTPGYERARFHFDAAIAAGVIEPNLASGFHWQHDIIAVLKWADRKKLKP